VAYDVELAERLRPLLAGVGVAEKRMFGGLAFLVGGHMAVAASGQGGLLVRVDPAETAQLLAEPGAEEFEMSGRGPMAGWLRVHSEALDDDAVLRTWVDRGVAYAASLPPRD
jgi:TfoX/Sxy family transcriptional regulator of competence genes